MQGKEKTLVRLYQTSIQSPSLILLLFQSKKWSLCENLLGLWSSASIPSFWIINSQPSFLTLATLTSLISCWAKHALPWRIWHLLFPSPWALSQDHPYGSLPHSLFSALYFNISFYFSWSPHKNSNGFHILPIYFLILLRKL